MSKPKTITIDEVQYVRAECVQPEPDGDRHIVILDRGFIFEGRLDNDDDGMRILTDAVNVRKWDTGGTGGMLASAGRSGATLDSCPPVKWQEGTEVFMAPTPKGWRNA